jgi:hypothetical protein
MALFRRRFADLITRQLDLFAADQKDRLRLLAESLDAHRRAGSDEAEATYGDHQDQVDWAASDLLAIRDAYTATLDEATARDYCRAFDRAASRRFPLLARAIASGDVD